MAQASMCVIYNPASGRGRGRRRLDRLRRALAGSAFWPTHAPGQAEELALVAARDGFATVGAAGGDGTVHEVANGLLRAGRPDVALAVLPVGSANDYAHSLGLAADWFLKADPSVGRRRVDVGLARAAGRSRYFVNGLGLGFNGYVTLESRRITFLRGLPLYALAFLRALVRHFRHPAMTVCLDDDKPRIGPTLALTLALGKREGNFTVAPEARLDDGLFDYIHAGALSRWGLLSYLPGLAVGRLGSHPAVHMGRCRTATVHCDEPLLAHVDGEFFCLPADGVHDLEVTLLPGALQVLGQKSSSQDDTSPER